MRAKDAPRLVRDPAAAGRDQAKGSRRADRPLDDTGVLGIVEKLIKQRKDSIEQFGKAGRTDLVDKEKAELDLLSGYLPQQMSEAELVAAVDAAIAEAGAAGPQAIGKVMALLKPRIAGRADMGQVSALVKKRLS